ncbi:MAG: GYD domain superfamily [Thermoprotei archaeon]|nr:MAG: GYD domain superfamily [Thermoprotei archaeon]
MGIYVLLSTLTAEGRKTVKERPERILEVNKEIETFGAKVLQQWAVLGPYDFVNIVEAPDNEAIARISVELGSRGTVHIISMPAIPVEQFIKSIKEKKA